MDTLSNKFCAQSLDFFYSFEVQILNMALPCRSIICIFYSLDWLVERVAKKEKKWTFSLVFLVYYFTKQFTLAFWVVDMWIVALTLVKLQNGCWNYCGEDFKVGQIENTVAGTEIEKFSKEGGSMTCQESSWCIQYSQTSILDLTCCIWLYFCIGLKVHSKDFLICYSRPTIWTNFFLLWAHTGRSTNLKSCLIYYFCGNMN